MEKSNKKQERFAIVPGWVFETPLSSSEKLVVAGLCLYRNKSGYCFPSVKELSRITSLGERSVARALNKLDESGTIKKRNRYRNKGQTSNEYFIPSVTATVSPPYAMMSPTP